MNETNEEFLSIVIPLFNKCEVIEETVGCLTKVLIASNFEYELIIVDDGSTDGSTEVVRTITNEMTLINLDVNSGKGFAVKKGVERAAGSVIVVFDADLDINPKSIVPLVNMLLKSKHDVVVASKYHTDSKIHMTFSRKQIGLMWARLTKLLIGITVNDSQTGLKVYRAESAKEIFAELQTRRFAFEVEVLLKANQLGMSIGEGPVEINRSFTGGVSIFDGFRALKDLLVIKRTNQKQIRK
jgi:dolichyl-phosphate beta-glucosyltransferase